MDRTNWVKLILTYCVNWIKFENERIKGLGDYIAV